MIRHRKSTARPSNGSRRFRPLRKLDDDEIEDCIFGLGCDDVKIDSHTASQQVSGSR
jgi:hypothetical protein